MPGTCTVVDPGLGVLADLLGPAEVMVCRLRADPPEVMRRLAGQRPGGSVREECARMDASGFAEVCVDTTGVPADRVALPVRAACACWPGFGGVAGEPGGAAASLGSGAGSEGDGSGGQVMLLCGPAGVGKSTVGFQLYLRCLRAGLTAAYIDLDQIGFLRPPAEEDPQSHGLKADNLAALWRACQAAGATHPVVTGRPPARLRFTPMPARCPPGP